MGRGGGTAGSVWRLEWRAAAARGRLIAWNVAVPLALLVPVAASGAAPAHRAAVYVVFVALFGVFGGCVPLVREGERGWTEKVLLTGVSPRRWLAERTAAHAGLDLLELAPALAVVAVLEGGSAAALAPAAALALLTANVLGAAVAASVRSLAESALVSAAVTLAAVHLTGVFRAAAPGTWARAAERASPFRPLLVAARRLVGSPVAEGGAGNGLVLAGGWSVWIPALAAGLVVAGAAWAGAAWIGRRIRG